VQFVGNDGADLLGGGGGLVGLVGKTMVPSLARVRMTVGQLQGASGCVGTAEKGMLAGEGVRDFGAGKGDEGSILFSGFNVLRGAGK